MEAAGPPATQVPARGKVHGAPIAEDPATQRVFAMAERVAGTRATVLIGGPSGAGKEVLARHIHMTGARAGRPFVAVNCAALPDTMLEALLFGHERGAFTGAAGPAEGLVRAADGGTLLLDEIAELPLALQAKLLRVLQEREVLPLGATRPVAVDVRLVAATNRDLAGEVSAGRFREDLYWRLAVFPLQLPSLAERPGDILPLARHFLASQAADGLAPMLLPDAEASLLAHAWPGNVRELGNVIERAAILAAPGPISALHLGLPQPGPQRHVAQQPQLVPIPSLTRAVKAREAEEIRAALELAGGRRSHAARHLGISERTLRYKLAALAGRPRTGGRPACASVAFAGAALQ
jgi:two-component system response regulator FlrC